MVVAGVAAGLSLRDPSPAADVRTPQSVVPSQAAAVTKGPALFDPLQTDASFSAASDDSGTCAIKKGLVVTARADSSAVCGEDARLVFPPSQNIAVRATLGDSGSCATISFRATSDEDEPNYLAGAYRAAVCPEETRLTSTIAAPDDPIATVRRATSTGVPHRILVVTTDRGATVSIDDTPVLEGELTESNLLSGRVMLGAEATGDRRAKVTFTDAQLRSGPDPSVPAVPAFTTGDAQITAGVWMLYEDHRLAIVEQAEYLSGKDYCRRYAVAASSPKCAKKTVPVYTGVRVTLPTAPGLKYLDFRDSPQKCLDPKTHAGTCEVRRDVFSEMLHEFDPWAGLVTIRAGKVVSVAHMDYH